MSKKDKKEPVQEEKNPIITCEGCKHLINKDQTETIDLVYQEYNTGRHSSAINAPVYPRAQWKQETLYFGSDCWKALIGEKISDLVRVYDGLDIVRDGYNGWEERERMVGEKVRYFNRHHLSGLDGPAYEEVTPESPREPDIVVDESLEL